MPTAYASPLEKVLDRVATLPDGCIIWLGGKTKQGYGAIRWQGKNLLCHRIIWQSANGPTTDGKVVNHKCFRRDCVNIQHLEAVTRSQNNQYTHARPGGYSQHKGVSWDKTREKWIAYVTPPGKFINCGYYDDELEAATAAMRRRDDLGYHLTPEDRTFLLERQAECPPTRSQ